jgi:peptidyl-prolyl cis-trans isomerase B (cyclophilin B)
VGPLTLGLAVALALQTAGAADSAGALAGLDPLVVDLQAVHELEWVRAEPQAFGPWLADPRPEVVNAAVLALARERDPAALPLLLPLMTHPDAGVQRQVAFALGQTPGAGEPLWRWLSEAPPPEGLHDRIAAPGQLMVAILDALGRQGGTEHITAVLVRVSEPWPVGAAAADALGRMARRQVAGVERSVPVLVAALSRPDPRTVQAAAMALGRVAPKTLTTTDALALSARASALPSPEARAALIRAVWKALPNDSRGDLIDRARRDPSPLVRTALADAVQSGDVGVGFVEAWLKDPDPGVRASTVAALGRSGEPGLTILRRLANTGDPSVSAWVAAVLAGAGGPDPARVDAGAEPPGVLAGLVEAVHDAPTLLRWAAEHKAPVVRSTAVAVLLEEPGRKKSALAWGTKLLEVADPVVREGAVELLADAPAAKAAPLLLSQLRIETDESVTFAGLEQLRKWLGANPRVIKPGDQTLSATLHLASVSSARVRRSAAAIARIWPGASAPEPTKTPDLKALVLPDGRVAAAGVEGPSLGATQGIRSAWVKTTRGSFQITLAPDVAPRAVDSFARLAADNFYDGLVFHRVVPGFVVQGGCPRGDGSGGPGYVLPDEISGQPFAEMSVGMARAGVDTGGSQWFVTLSDQPHLTGDYTWFGRVTHGQEVVKALVRGDAILDVHVEVTGPK